MSPSPWSKPEIKEEKPIETKSQVIPQEAKKEDQQTFVIKTELDAYINERVQTQPKSFEEITIKEQQEPDQQNRMALPKEIKSALEKRGMTPRWINKDKRAIDRALDVRGWTIFNRVLFPEIKKHLFTANGTVEHGDCILGFMPAERAEKLRKRPGEISQERIKNLPIDRYKESTGGEKIGYYKPAYTAEPEGQVLKEGAGLFAQPDLPVNE